MPALDSQLCPPDELRYQTVESVLTLPRQGQFELHVDNCVLAGLRSQLFLGTRQRPRLDSDHAQHLVSRNTPCVSHLRHAASVATDQDQSVTVCLRCFELRL